MIDKKNEFSRVSVIKMDHFEIPYPSEKVNRGKSFIEWGLDNLFPNYLISLLSRSSLHSAIVKQKAMLIGGQGFAKVNIQPETMLFLKNVYNEDDLDEILFKIAMDLEVYGGFYLNLVWSKDGSKISEINYVDPSKVRIATPDKSDKYPQTECYWICEGWEDMRKYEPVLYQGFSTVNKKHKSQILYVKEYRPGTEWYARPEYEAGLRWIELEWEISNWHLNNVKKGFTPNMHINIPIGQNPSSEEIETIIRRLKEQYQGSNQAGNPVITFSDSKENMATFDPIQLNSSDSYLLQTNDSVTDGILKAHRINNPELFGEKTSGELGSSSDYLESLELFQTQYIEPKQRLIEKTFNRIRKINGITDNILINKYSPQFSGINTNITDVLQILESQLEPKIKYHLLVSNGYTHELSMNLSGYKDGNNSVQISKEEQVMKSHNHSFSNEPPCHRDCKCEINDGIWENEPDMCDYCSEMKSQYESDQFSKKEIKK